MVTTIFDNIFLSVGFSILFDIVLFEEHGAMPYGGDVTGGTELTYATMVVIDVSAHYLGYSTDICRSFLIDPPPHYNSNTGLLWKEKQKVWQVVLDAQAAAAAAFQPNVTAASIDIPARTVIEEAGYGDAFTHRLGHGIGIKGHESPFLNKLNTGDRLHPGMTFTDEPGIYLESKFGVRHEDVYLVTKTGKAELLSRPLAKGPRQPWAW